ncbi:MAG: NAD(P)(+) transhydrogenase (Re/Si-specific) subunit beta [Phycisphaerales bacterium]|nr:NAD(P)(+) transhydrogenase (Re/Si-specific) subunit beta [Phycisphaerales bacterium]
MTHVVNAPDILLIIACAAFIVGLKRMARKDSAPRGNIISAAGMVAAVAGVLWQHHTTMALTLALIAAGSVVGVMFALRVRMTAMPELIALFNGLGGLASLCVGFVALLPEAALSPITRALSATSVIVGGVTFTGSIVAYAKLAGKINTSASVFPFQLTISAAVLALALASGAWAVVSDADQQIASVVLVVASLVLGVLAVARIGGGNMPVVVSLLNSLSGVAAAVAGTAIASPALMIAGTLVGASGLMLTRVMCKSMNRSLSKVLFAGFGAVSASGREGDTSRTISPINASDAFLLLEAARSVIVVPGYGMAVAKAQHAVHELSELLQANGTDVRFVIHPVAGRMPGHMNVLLAEAGVNYDLLSEPADVNDSMGLVDVALVIGANDVVNPDARNDPASPLYGMPVVNVDLAKAAIVLKRSMAPGFAGVDNALFTSPNTRMLFGDAKASIVTIVEQFAS